MAVEYARQEHGARYDQHTGAGFNSQVARWRRVQEPRPLTTALGWFSLGLGLAELLAPGDVARLVGVNDDEESRTVLQALGVREIASGVGILTQARPTGWLWARVAGDLMDLALLNAALGSERSQRDRVGAAMLAVAGIGLLDLHSSQQASDSPGALARYAPDQHGVEVQQSVTVNRSPEELYRFWRDFQNLPRFMKHLEAVEVIDQLRSRWTAKAPVGMKVAWDAEISADQPNELIAWRSLPGADVENSGTVRFVRAPGGRGTEVHVHLRYSPPGGAIGVAIAKLFAEEPGQQVHGDLRRFKQVMETGEVVLSDATAHASHPLMQPAAQPHSS